MQLPRAGSQQTRVRWLSREQMGAPGGSGGGGDSPHLSWRGPDPKPHFLSLRCTSLSLPHLCVHTEAVPGLRKSFLYWGEERHHVPRDTNTPEAKGEGPQPFEILFQRHFRNYVWGLLLRACSWPPGGRTGVLPTTHLSQDSDPHRSPPERQCARVGTPDHGRRLRTGTSSSVTRGR